MNPYTKLRIRRLFQSMYFKATALGAIIGVIMNGHGRYGAHIEGIKGTIATTVLGALAGLSYAYAWTKEQNKK